MRQLDLNVEVYRAQHNTLSHQDALFDTLELLQRKEDGGTKVAWQQQQASSMKRGDA